MSRLTGDNAIKINNEMSERECLKLGFVVAFFHLTAVNDYEKRGGDDMDIYKLGPETLYKTYSDALNIPDKYMRAFNDAFIEGLALGCDDMGRLKATISFIHCGEEMTYCQENSDVLSIAFRSIAPRKDIADDLFSKIFIIFN